MDRTDKILLLTALKILKNHILFKNKLFLGVNTDSDFYQP